MFQWLVLGWTDGFLFFKKMCIGVLFSWRCWVPQNWSYRQLWAAVWVLEIESGSSGREVHTLNHCTNTVSPAPWAYRFLRLKYSVKNYQSAYGRLKCFLLSLRLECECDICLYRNHTANMIQQDLEFIYSAMAGGKRTEYSLMALFGFAMSPEFLSS